MTWPELVHQVIPWALSANTIALNWLAGNQRNLGWLLGVIGQVVWFIFIFTWQVWGFLPMAIGLSIVYARNLIKWRNERSQAVAEAKTAALHSRTRRKDKR